jgi:SAM-dependent methyltransferase
MLQATIDLAAIKTRQQGAWATGNYAVVGTTLQGVGESLCEALDLRPGSRVLDIAAGNGNATLAAARRFAKVTSTDYVPSLLESGRRRASAEGLAVDFLEADAENLPFPDASFDVALSTFGVMFTPDQEKAASELLRVVRPGGRIGLANWTPDGFVGHMFRILGKHVPPAPGLKSPALWGTRERLGQLFGTEVEIRVKTLQFNFRYLSPAHFVDVFRTYYGPMNKAFAALAGDWGKLRAFEDDLAALVERSNRSDDGTLVAPGDYLEVVIQKPGGKRLTRADN